MIRFIVFGETPSKKNSKIITKQGKIIPSRAHTQWHADALLQMNAQLSRLFGKEPALIEEPVKITLTFYHGDRVRRDSDNQASSIMDLLQDAKVLVDDRWQIVRELCIKNFYEKNHARCLIEICNYTEQL